MLRPVGSATSLNPRWHKGTGETPNSSITWIFNNLQGAGKNVTVYHNLFTVSENHLLQRQHYVQAYLLISASLNTLMTNNCCTTLHLSEQAWKVIPKSILPAAYRKASMSSLLSVSVPAQFKLLQLSCKPSNTWQWKSDPGFRLVFFL